MVRTAAARPDAGCNNEDSEKHSGTWDEFLLKLNDSSLASLPGRTMFEHILHTIYLLIRSSNSNPQVPSANLCDIFDEDPAITVRSSPKTFMNALFIPVATAMDRIFNWRQLYVTGATTEME